MLNKVIKNLSEYFRTSFTTFESRNAAHTCRSAHASYILGLQKGCSFICRKFLFWHLPVVWLYPLLWLESHISVGIRVEELVRKFYPQIKELVRQCRFREFYYRLLRATCWFMIWSIAPFALLKFFMQNSSFKSRFEFSALDLMSKFRLITDRDFWKCFCHKVWHDRKESFLELLKFQIHTAVITAICSRWEIILIFHQFSTDWKYLFFKNFFVFLYRYFLFVYNNILMNRTTLKAED